MVDGEPGSDGAMVSVFQTVGLKLDREIILAVSLHSLEARGHEAVSKMPGDLQVRGSGVTLECDLRKVTSSGFNLTMTNHFCHV